MRLRTTSRHRSTTWAIRRRRARSSAGIDANLVSGHQEEADVGNVPFDDAVEEHPIGAPVSGLHALRSAHAEGKPRSHLAVEALTASRSGPGTDDQPIAAVQ
jgi:hypothetical protein